MRWLTCCAESRSIAPNLAYLLHTLLTAEPFARHREWLAGDPSLCQLATHVLLARSLASLPAEVAAAAASGSFGGSAAESMLRHLPTVLHPTSALCTNMQLLPATVAAAAVLNTATAVEALPLPKPAGMHSHTLTPLHFNAVLLLCWCCHVPAVQQAGGRDQPEHLQSAWRLVALLPRLAATVQALAGDLRVPPGVSEHDWLTRLGRMCSLVASALEERDLPSGQPATVAQLACWAAAATAGLRLQPLLLQLHARLQQMPGDDTSVSEGVQLLSTALVQFWRGMPELQQPAAASAADSAHLATSLAELHCTGCRYAQFVASQGSGVLAVCPPDKPSAIWTGCMLGLTSVSEQLLKPLYGQRCGKDDPAE